MVAPQPTHAVCGYPLRWFPDLGAWGCDQCRVMVQAQPRKSLRPLWLALAAVGTVGVGVGAAFLVGGGHHGGLASSVDDAVKRTFAALGKGDAEALVANAGMDTLRRYQSCTHLDEAREAEDFADMRKELERAARRENGTTFEVLKVDEVKHDTREKGSSLGKDCTLEAAMTHHEVDVSLAVTRDGARSETHATVHVLEIDGNFAVVNAPKIKGCSLAVARVMLLEQREGSARAIDHDQCTKDKWPDAKISCVAEAISFDEIDRCINDGKLRLPASCDAYAAAMKRLEACMADSDIKQTLVDGFRSEQAYWAKMTTVHPLLAESCQNHATQTEQIITSYCK